MEKKTKIIQVHQPASKEIEVFVTSDGREFSEREQEAAERWQKRIDEIKEYKKLVNYTPCELDGRYSGEHEHSFIFDWKPEYDSRIVPMLTELRPDNKMQEGRYLVIEYREDNQNGRDWFTGYFGLLSDYIPHLEQMAKATQEQLDLAKSLLTH